MKEAAETTGIVVAALSASCYAVRLDDDGGRSVVATDAGLWRRHIRVRRGDFVLVKLTADRATIAWRYR